jgi:hypothetical protein
VQPDAGLILDAADYDLTSTTNQFDSTITANSGFVAVTTGDGQFVMNGVLNLNNTTGAIPGWHGNTLHVGDGAGSAAQLNVGGAGTSYTTAPVVFRSDAAVQIGAGATLLLAEAASTVEVGATFGGAGDLAIAPDGVLSLVDQVTLGVHLHNDGVLSIAEDAIGENALESFSQGATGSLLMDLGGDESGEFDAFHVVGSATLDGALQLRLGPGYTPALGQAITVLTASSAMGSFANVIQPLGMPAGLMFSADYSPTTVQLEVIAAPVVSADFNNDGEIDGADLAKWQGDFGANAGSDADGDGDSDGADFLAWQRQVGASAGRVSGAHVPEPATAWLIALFAALGLRLWRPRG